jgi:hypothetical protein
MAPKASGTALSGEERGFAVEDRVDRQCSFGAVEL